MRRRIVYIGLLLIVPLFYCHAQETTSGYWEFQAGGGRIEYMSNPALPSGLPGSGFGFSYRSGRPLRERSDRFREFTVQFYKAKLIKHFSNGYSTLPYSHYELKGGYNYICRFTSGIPSLTVDAGLRLSMNVLFGYNSEDYISHEPYGHWYISPEIVLRAAYSYRKFSLATNLNAPVMGIGFFREYSVYHPLTATPLELFLFYATPNSAVLANRLRSLDNSLSVGYKIGESDRFTTGLQLVISNSITDFLVHGNREMKNSSLLSLGILIQRK